MLLMLYIQVYHENTDLLSFFTEIRAILVLDFLFSLAEKSRFGDRSYSGMA